MNKRGIGWVAAIFLLLFACLAGRLGYLMLARGAELAAQAEKQHIRSLDYYQYSRGDITDSKGRAFTSQVEPCLVLIPSMLHEGEEIAASLSALLDLPEKNLRSLLQAIKKQQVNPVILKTGLRADQAEAVRQAALPGVVVLHAAARYGREAVATHLLGQLQATEVAGVMKGVSGLEQQYDAQLQGRVDDQLISWVDATGGLSSNDWHIVTPEQPYHQNVSLTLDMDYQQIAERALGEYQGACVILNPHNGDILAAASSPGFDPYGWQPPATDDAYVNKAFAYYPPASTFKILLALAAADKGLPSSLSDFSCQGSTDVAGSHHINCWNRAGHGREGLAQALANSCNPYFATLGWELGGDVLREYLQGCGLDKQTVLGYSVSQAPSLEFNSAVPGDVANVSIGENGARLSPLMVAQLVSVCANGGYRVTPRLVQAIRDSEGQVVWEVPAVEPERAVGAMAAADVGAMLRLAVSEGTLKALGNTLLPVAAKTGTSEDAGVWCAGFAPYAPYDSSASRWAIAVYVADGLSGGQEAAAVFKAVVDDIAVLEGLAP